jgi:AAA15 family ATPase/GTPase
MKTNLKYIEIKKYKCFKDFEAKGFKRVNLISGINNTGKTSLLEALWTNLYSNDIDSMWTSLSTIRGMRNNLEYVFNIYNSNIIKGNLESIENYSVKTNINDSIFSFNKLDDDLKEYSFNINYKLSIVDTRYFKYTPSYYKHIRFIDHFGLSNNELKEIYLDLEKKNKEDILYRLINEFDDDLLNMKILGDDNPYCKMKHNNKYKNINDFGGGIKNYISIICSLYACENGYLFIDRLENGIHYSKIDRLWEIIFIISKELNVQVFTTTDSKECIKSYIDVSKRIDDNDVTYIELLKNKDAKIEALFSSYKLFEYGITENHKLKDNPKSTYFT